MRLWKILLAGTATICVAAGAVVYLNRGAEVAAAAAPSGPPATFANVLTYAGTLLRKIGRASCRERVCLLV